MIRACITGGIATGKSALMAFLRDVQATQAREWAFFDCDACVHELLVRGDVVAAVVERFGPTVAALEGGIDRARLRQAIFHAPEGRKWLEGLLHPEVRRLCVEASGAAEAGGALIFWAEVPLLYESGFDVARDYEIVVATSPETQMMRLRERRGLTEDSAQRILDAQWPIMQKVARADLVIWNGGQLECLKRQAITLLDRLCLTNR
jgi:dephospho-CoA kinase